MRISDCLVGGTWIGKKSTELWSNCNGLMNPSWKDSERSWLSEQQQELCMARKSSEILCAQERHRASRWLHVSGINSSGCSQRNFRTGIGKRLHHVSHFPPFHIGDVILFYDRAVKSLGLQTWKGRNKQTQYPSALGDVNSDVMSG